MATKPLGKSLPPIRPEQILPFPSEQEFDATVARWNANCPPFYVGLLEAEPIEKKKGTSKFVFDKSRNLYIVRRTWRVIPRRDIMRAFIEYQRRVAGL